MSAMRSEPCIVCGTPTKNRCSSCAKAGIDLFFCSSDHQKLVWKVHRTVCGPGKAHPILFPYVHADEIPILLAAADVEVPLDEFKKKCTNVTATDALKCVRKGKVTIKRAFCSQGGIDESSFYKHAIGAYLEGNADAAEEIKMNPHPLWAWIAMLRRHAFLYTPVPDGTKAARHFPVPIVAATIELALRPLPGAGFPALPPSLNSIFKHRILVVSALLQLESARPDLLVSAVQQVLDLWFGHPLLRGATVLDMANCLGSLGKVINPVANIEFELEPGPGGLGGRCECKLKAQS